MKIKFSVLILLLFTLTVFSQENKNNRPFLIRESKLVKRVLPLAGRTLTPVDLSINKNHNRNWLNMPTNHNALPNGPDPLVNNKNKSNRVRIPGSPVIQSFDGAIEGTHTGAGVPDSTGAVGPNHYIHSYNSGFVIFDKTGNVLVPHNALSNIFPGENDGDPVILYDRYADRFIITQFKVMIGNAFLVAICQGPDPVNDGWDTYQFNVDSMPDYPKFSVWHDGYYITANKSGGHNVYVINRDEVIAGASTAQIVGFNLPGVEANPNTVFAPLPMNSIGPNLPESSTPGYVVYLQDDAWATGPDHLKIWEIDTDWVTAANSTISDPTQINTTAFDSFVAGFGSGEVPQPGTSQKIDGITGIVSFACNYYAFDDHNSVTLNFNVDVDGNDTKLGIRWYELRDNSGSWSIEQEGTFAPADTLYRFMGSMAIDEQGNIGMAYSRADSGTFTSLYFTGRHANDTLGEMTIDEELIVEGKGVNALHNRYGDYAHLTLDPTDNKTFWFVGEYFDNSNNWRTRVASFKIAPNAANDVGIIAITSPNNATLSNAEEVTVSVFNFGQNPQSNFPMTLSVDGVAITTEVFPGTIQPSSSASFSFTTIVNLSNTGQTYEISAVTILSGDEDNNNDAFTKNVTNLEPNDVGVISLNSPVSGIGLSNSEAIVVTIQNFGGMSQTNFDVTYTIDGVTPVTEIITSTLGTDSTMNYTFTQTADLSNVGNYPINITTSLGTDSNTSNDAIDTIIIHSNCQPNLNCNSGDGLYLFQLGSINNPSDCDGYGDFTNLSTDLDVDSTNNLTLNTHYGNQHVNVWIDFDDNFVFTTDELVVTDYIIGSGQNSGDYTETTNLDIPTTTYYGSHLLRAKTNWDAPVPDDACEVTSFGETEDYTVNILSPTASVQESYLNTLEMTVATIGKNKFNVILPTSKFNETMVITLHNMLGQRLVRNRVENNEDVYSYDLDLNGLSAGVYLIRLGTSTFGKVKQVIVE